MAQPVHQEQFGVKYLTKGHIDMKTGGARNRTTDLPVSGRPALPPEPQLPPSQVIKRCGVKGVGGIRVVLMLSGISIDHLEVAALNTCW